MKLALPVLDTLQNRQILAGGLNANGFLCVFDTRKDEGCWLKIAELAENMADLLPALQKLDVSAIITRQLHPMALKILINKGFNVYKAQGNELSQNINLYRNHTLEPYSHEAAMALADVCGGECSTCSTDVCDDEKKQL